MTEELDLKKQNPEAADLCPEKKKAEEELLELNEELERLQEKLWASSRQRVLVVLQGMDASGKDGVIRRVFEGVNPVGVRVASFKVPTQEELAHDFLWRVHQKVPANGELVIFNRSHYEDVLVVRVRGLVPSEVWKLRYRQIVDFERLLVETGTTIIKFFLHISKEEQKQRILERLHTPSKLWKFRLRDLEDRKLWYEYHQAYQDALVETSRPWAPWYVVPANRKWYRDLVVARVLVGVLGQLDLELPQPSFDPGAIIVP